MTTPTQFEIECALISGAADDETRGVNNKFPVPAGYKLYDNKNSEGGFDATSYKNGNTIVIAFAPTNTREWCDIFTDVVLGFGGADKQLMQAAEYYMYIKSLPENEGAKIVFTGHSLGGGLAALMGAFFDEEAVVFDPAPFENALSEINKEIILKHLSGDANEGYFPRLFETTYTPEQIATLAPELQSFTNSNAEARTNTNISGYYVEGEFCRTFPIADEFLSAEKFKITHGDTNIDGGDLHSLSLLTTFLLNDDFRNMTSEIPGLLDMLFDSKLYHYEKDKEARNFLEHLVRHQEGYVPLAGGEIIEADDMLTRFTDDLVMIAQDGGLSLADENVTKALTAFAMQMYYDNPDAAKPENFMELFNYCGVTGGIHFDRSDVGASLADAPGYYLYFKNYLSVLPGNETGIMTRALPGLLDWYIQAGPNSMTATAGDQTAFMLGWNGTDNLTGGTAADLLYGGVGVDILTGGDSADTLIGGTGDDFLYGGMGNDTYIINEGDGFDTIEDKQGDNNRLILCGNETGFFYYDKNSYTYVSFNGDQTAVFNGSDLIVTDKVTGTSVKLNEDFQWGEFGINLINTPAGVTTDNPITGDLTPIDFDPDTEGVQMQYDQWGNVIVDPNQPAPGRADILYDTSGNDLIIGGAGDDNINTVHGGSDRIQGGAGNDNITQYSGDVGVRETLYNSIIEGGSGSDIILGHYTVSNQLFGDSYGDMETLIAAGETAPNLDGRGDFISDYYLPEYGQTSSAGYLYGSDGRDILINNTGMGLIVGGGGDDLIYGDFNGVINANNNNTWDYTIEITKDEDGANIYTSSITGIDITNNTAAGAGNDDVIYAGNGNDFVLAGGGDDEVYGGSGSDTLFGDAGSDFIEGGAGDDILVGDNGDLLTSALTGDDYIDGGDGNDDIEGQGGNDELFGGVGNDTIYGGDGDDYLDGEAGENKLYGNAGNDVIFGDVDNDYIEGDDAEIAGNDYLDGMAGDDTIIGAGGADTIYGGEGNDELHGDATNVAETDQGDDYIDGEGGNNLIVGYGGNDTLIAAEGNDTIDGGDGDDYIDAGDGINEIYGGDGSNDIYAGSGNDYIVGGIEGGTGSNYIDGGEGNNTLFGGDGDDMIFTGAGDDWLQGGKGNDYLDGGAGNNTLLGGDGNDDLIGGGGIDILQGDAGDDYLAGLEGNDTLMGIDGNDTLFGDDGDDHVQGDAGDDYLDGGIGNDYMMGMDGLDTVFGGAGNDSIWGGAGNDSMYGEDGNDQLSGEAGDDYIDGGDGDDWLQCGTGNDTLAGGRGNDTYYFNIGNGSKTIIDTASEGEINTLIFGNGITPDDLQLTIGSLDILIGSNGDGIHFDNFDPNDAYGTHALDRFEFADGTLLNYSELIELGFDISGTSGDDQISGTNATDRINALYGNDYIVSGEGNDSIDGGDGNDTMIGGRGNDTLIGGRGNDTYIINKGDGSDTIVNFADDYVTATNTVQFGDGITSADLQFAGDGNDLRINIIGTANWFTIQDWFSGEEFRPGQFTFADATVLMPEQIDSLVIYPIFGTTGDDNITGSAGADIMIGCAGNDTYVVNNIGDVVMENTGEGNDTVQSSIAYTLGDNVEKLVLTGNDAINGYGNELGNTISGNDNDNVLSGDTGNDTLTGGGGNDTYLFNRGDGVDTIYNYAEDGSTAIDKVVFGEGITLADLEFVKSQYDSALIVNIKGTTDSLIVKNQIGTVDDCRLDQFQFADGTIITEEQIEANGFKMYGTDDYDCLIGSAGNDTIYGYAGDDNLHGNGGDDIFDGGVGNDYMVGGSGDDIYVFNRGSGSDEIDNHAYDWDYICPKDAIKFGEGITLADLDVSQDGTDLLINIQGTTDSLRIDAYFYSSWYRVGRYEFVDGTVLDLKQFEEAKVNSTLYGTYRNDEIMGTCGNDTIYGYAGNDQLYGRYGGNDILYGGDGNDTLYAESPENTYNCTLDGGSGDDYLFGSNGNDALNGGSGDDYLFGSNGNDTYIFGVGYGQDTIYNYYYGENGVDIISLDSSIQEADVSFEYSDGGLIISLANSPDTLRVGDWFYDDNKIEYVKFSNGTTLDYGMINQMLSQTTEGDDRLFGGNNNDILSGLGGNDTIYGYRGDDTIDGGADDDHLCGGAGNDVIDGCTGNDLLEDSQGNDTYIFGCGYGQDQVYDFEGNLDSIVLNSNLTPADIQLAAYGGDLVLSIQDTSDNLTVYGFFEDPSCQVENILFADGTSWNLDEIYRQALNPTENDDELYGFSQDDIIQGFGGDDKIHGGEGNDYLSGNAGNDEIFGNAGNDYLAGGVGNDRIIGGQGNDTLSGGRGDDFLDGGEGDNRYIFNRGDGSDFIALGNNPSGNESLMFGEGIVPSDLSVQVSAGVAMGGEATPFNNVLIGIDIGIAVANPLADQTTLEDELYTFTVPAGTFDNDDILIGPNNDGDLLRLASSAIVEQGGDLPGEISLKKFIFADGQELSLDQFLALADGGVIGYQEGTDGDDFLKGSSFDDEIYGYGGNDVILAGKRNDYIDGGDGDDTLDGGSGMDYLQGGAGNDTYLFGRGSALDEVSEWDDTPGNVDTILLKDGITYEDIRLFHEDNHLILSINGTDDTLIIYDYFFDPACEIEQIQLSDGTLININDFLDQPQENLPDIYTGDILTYSATLADGSALPSWLTFDSATMTFSGTPGNDDVGMLSLKITAADASGESVSDDYDLTVVNVNDAPFVVNPLADQTIKKGSSYSYVVPADTFRDIDVDDVLTYSATLADGSALPSWLTFDSATMTFSGTPTKDDVGMLSLKIIATDIAGASASNDFNVTVESGNEVPVVATPLVDQTTLEDELYTFTVPADTFVDVDAGDSLTFSATFADGSSLPLWLTFDPATQTFSGTPTNNDVGSLSLKVTATDTSGENVADDYNLTVINVNDPPFVVNPIMNQSATEDALFIFTVPADTFADIDVDDVLTYSATLADGSALPSWLMFDATTRTFNGIPTNDDVGMLSLKVTATDMAGASASNDFNLTVMNVNDTPGTPHPLADQTTLEDALYTLTVPGNTFADVDVGDSLTYRATLTDGSALPSWLTFDAATMTFIGTPGNDDVGTLSLKVTATDKSGASVSDDYNLTVINVNDPPFVVNPLADQTINKCSYFSYTVPIDTFEDIDVGDVLTYSATLADGSALPSWLTFDAATRTFSGTPICTGNMTIKITATDTSNASASDIFSLDIRKITYGTNCCDFIITCCDNDLIYALNGYDKVYSGGGNDTIYGGNDNDYLCGESGNDLIYGENGNDYLYGDCGNDTLDGGTGADNMAGGSGNDTYVVDKLPSGLFNLIPGDEVTEYCNEGIDTVKSSVTYSLGNNVENLILTGTSAISGTGNTLNNVLTGNSAVNTLIGNSGNDTLDGGQGNDILTGGNGSDTYLFRRNDGKDTVNETSGMCGDKDTLKLIGGISTTEPVLVKQGNDLYVFIDENNYMRIANEFQATNYGIERLEVSDGHYITRQDIQTIIDTMSSINNDSGMDVMQKYTELMNNEQYQNILAQSWQ